MSTAFVVGMFSLINGVRRSEQTGTSQTFYCFYDTAFRSEITTSTPAQLRVYSPVGGQVARDDTLAFVVAKAYFDRDGPDPESYYDNVPEFDMPLLFAVGRVTPASASDGPAPPIRRFDLAVSEYVRNTVQHCTAEIMFNSSVKRWANTPMPASNTSVGVLAVSYGLASNGILRFEMLSLALNVSPAVSVGGGSTSSRAATTGTGSRKDRFSARASGNGDGSVVDNNHRQSRASTSTAPSRVTTSSSGTGEGMSRDAKLPPEAYHPETPALYESVPAEGSNSTKEEILSQLDASQIEAMVAILRSGKGADGSGGRRSPSPAGRGKRQKKSKK
ncbi:hypothetical protein CONPUDRAFT_152787 [Coniophora puteana RWD-64-598 SS2]|uniref:Uncharacterized protein n=1 Tax=Coniophora puteana (strain RWD-64-598) TaxID=741705 RepID=A0A5M3MRV1_CONPW|nr:uncharacterized protein CONPUDRAFT_152787 [Coniophora puteana RWD-64-598 SS2]EIW81882.1 hypothetical protein CONPUDRAFT_152787 [Coniophora puteana RWD-64-598 SS2]